MSIISFRPSEEEDPLAPPSFEGLCAIEPRIRQLHDEVRSIQDDKSRSSFCANALWFGWKSKDGGLRERLDDLVGFRVKREDDPRLRTWAAHNIARHAIYNALPDCRNCACMTLEDFRRL